MPGTGPQRTPNRVREDVRGLVRGCVWVEVASCDGLVMPAIDCGSKEIWARLRASRWATWLSRTGGRRAGAGRDP